MKRIKVAFVSQPFGSVLPPLQDSIGIVTYEIARRLVKSCEVIVYARGRFRRREECREGVHYRYIPMVVESRVGIVLKVCSGFLRRKRPVFSSPLYCLGYAVRIAYDLRREQCDIVHIQNFSQFVPIIRALNPMAKIVLHMHCEWLTELERTMIERRLRKVDLIAGCSEHITEKIRRNFPQLAGRCRTIVSGADVDHFVPKNGERERDRGGERLLFVGRVSPEKGVHVLLEAFQKVTKLYSEARLEVVGPMGATPIEFIVALSDDSKVCDLASFYRGRYLSKIQELCVSGRIGNQVSFAGHVSHLELVDYYRNADVVINPSLSEALGRSVIEAMACGVPVVATRVGGMTETVEDGRTGLLVEPGNAGELAEAIIRLLGDEDLRGSMGKAGRERAVRLFSWQQVVENVLQQYRSIGGEDV